MKALLTILLLSVSSFSHAAKVKVFCLSENPKGAIFLNLDTAQGQSFGRQSHPYTMSLDALKGKNPRQDQYNKLNVAFVEKTAYGFSFNASPYQVVNHPEVIKLTKSHVYLNRTPVVLDLFEDRGNIVMNCEIIK